MFEIIEVQSKKQQKQFVSFPLELYKGNKNFVPPLYSDEMKIFKDKNTYFKTCDSIFYLAKNENKIVGRIQGILQKQYNQIQGKNQVRFTRFDCIDNQEVANALFNAVIEWGKTKNATEIVGTLGYSDLEREGLLIDGFDYLSTFEEQYNYSYYQKLIENVGFEKDVDWVEYRIFPETYQHEKLIMIGERAMGKFNLHFGGEDLSKREFVKKYQDGIFYCLDECYKHLYGTVPFTEDMKKQMISQFNLVINKNYIFVICDENERVISFGIALPAIGKAVQKSGGKLTLPTIFKILKSVRKPKALDFALVGVLPEYQRTGLNAIFLAKVQKMITSNGIEYIETNLNLEDNYAVQSQWRYFKHIQHKRRRAFKKTIN